MLTPSTVIDWRREVAAWIPSLGYSTAHSIDWEQGTVARTLGYTLRQWMATYTESISRAGCYLVTAEMLQLVQAAAPSLTDIPRFAAEDLPSNDGFIVYDGPLMSEPRDDGSPRVYAGITWTAFPQTDGGGVLFGVLTSRDRSTWPTMDADTPRRIFPPLVPTRHLALPFQDLGGQLMANTTDNDSYGENVVKLSQLVLTTWLLMGQTVADQAKPDIDRATARRARRAKTGTDITVITLRRPAHHQDGNDGTGRDYTCQWLVRGHWRNQWHPARGVHRPIWVAPYIKGPEDKPFRTTERVYAWTR